MTIHKCDKCGAKINGESIQLGVGYFNKIELCKKCSKTLVEFLKSSDFLIDQLEKNGFLDAPKSKNAKKITLAKDFK
jgi:DNA-directed RNA polymerase subunit RPC12/RpoP